MRKPTEAECRLIKQREDVMNCNEYMIEETSFHSVGKVEAFIKDKNDKWVKVIKIEK